MGSAFSPCLSCPVLRGLGRHPNWDNKRKPWKWEARQRELRLSLKDTDRGSTQKATRSVLQKISDMQTPPWHKAIALSRGIQAETKRSGLSGSKGERTKGIEGHWGREKEGTVQVRGFAPQGLREAHTEVRTLLSKHTCLQGASGELRQGEALWVPWAPDTARWECSAWTWRGPCHCPVPLVCPTANTRAGWWCSLPLY